MLKSLLNDDCVKFFDSELKNLSHAYLFFSEDAVLNNEIAMFFAMSYFCGKTKPCFECEACRKNLILKNPDLMILDKPVILVEDVEKIIDYIQLKPMNFDKKIIIINNAENINEISQNKLLKSLEEPSDTVIFILTSTNVDKLLPTVKSRLKKIFLSVHNFDLLKEELKADGARVELLNSSMTLTEIISFSNDADFKRYFDLIKNLVFDLKTTQNIPSMVFNLGLNSQNKFIYLELLSRLFNMVETGEMFGEDVENFIKSNYNINLLSKINLLIEDSYKKLKANVNANYVFDNLFYEILKEKYLCKQ